MKILPLIFALSIASFGTFNFAQASESLQDALPTNVIITTVNQVAEVLNENYVYPEIATQMQEHLNQQVSAGEYDNSHSLRELITSIESDLRKVSGDGHIDLLLAEDSVDRTSPVLSITKSQEKIHAEIFSENGNDMKIGYLQINTFSGNLQTEDQLVQAMKRVADTDSLIIDLRKNGGGDPKLVALLSSYFLEADTLLWSILDRNGDQILEVRSQGNTNRFTGDLCILISYETYSAAEAFAYTLKHLGRACIVGAASGGGAHLIDMMRVNDVIDFRIPVVRAYNYITKSNWEGVGVIPTIKVEASEAKTAAIEYLINTNHN